MRRSSSLRLSGALVLLALLVSGCESPPVDVAKYPQYVETARVAWPVVMGTPFPQPYDGAADERLHETIRTRWGLERVAFRNFQGYFAAAMDFAERDEILAATAQIAPEDYAKQTSAERARAWVEAYLEAIRAEASSGRFWLGREPRRAFDRLHDWQPARSAAAPDALQLGGIVVPGWRITHRCLVSDLQGRKGWRPFVFEVTGLPPRLGIVRILAGEAVPTDG